MKRVRVSEPPLALVMVAPCVWLCLTNVLIQEFRPVTWPCLMTGRITCDGRASFRGRNRVFGIIEGVYGWAVVLTLIGYAAAMLDQRSRALTYLTDAVLPIYVVHQPIMLVAAYLGPLTFTR